MYTVPEEDGYNISFKKSGYESVLLIVNASPVVWMYILYFTAMVFLFGPICLIHKLSGKLATIKKKTVSLLFLERPDSALLGIFLRNGLSCDSQHARSQLGHLVRFSFVLKCFNCHESNPPRPYPSLLSPAVLQKL